MRTHGIFHSMLIRFLIGKLGLSTILEKNTTRTLCTQTYHVPMEFCCIDEGQRFTKEHLNKYQSDKLRNISLATSKCRESTIYDKVAANCEQVWIATSKVKHGQNPSIASPCAWLHMKCVTYVCLHIIVMCMSHS